MRGFILLFTLHFHEEHPGGDRWFSPDKAKHFFTAAFVQSVSFSGFRTVRLGRTDALVGATAITSLVSVGKEIYDQHSGGSASLKDLTWDGAGMLTATALLRRTEP